MQQCLKALSGAAWTGIFPAKFLQQFFISMHEAIAFLHVRFGWISFSSFAGGLKTLPAAHTVRSILGLSFHTFLSRVVATARLQDEIVAYILPITDPQPTQVGCPLFAVVHVVFRGRSVRYNGTIFPLFGGDCFAKERLPPRNRGDTPLQNRSLQNQWGPRSEPGQIISKTYSPLSS
jgi:hypothetical protein